jgi:ubiquinone/menaquinone biosynthesis C-methylase UbiE
MARRIAVVKEEARTDWTGKRGKQGAFLMARPVRRLEEALLGRSSAALLKRVFSILKGDMVVLDVGCGSGYLSLPIARKLDSGRVICVDLSEEMLAGLARRARAAAVSDRIQVIRTAVDTTGLADAAVEVVVSNNLLHELHDPVAAVTEWERVLKPGGHMALSDFRTTRLTNLLMSHEHGEEANDPFDVEGLRTLLQEAGLENVEVTPYRNKLLALADKPA